MWMLKSAHYAHAEATVRVMRKTPDGPLEESRQITMLGGKPVPPDKQVHDFPLDHLDVFAGLSATFVRQEYRYSFNFVPAPIMPLDAARRTSWLSFSDERTPLTLIAR